MQLRRALGRGRAGRGWVGAHSDTSVWDCSAVAVAPFSVR
jgi:hypothetical protein